MQTARPCSPDWRQGTPKRTRPAHPGRSAPLPSAIEGLRITHVNISRDLPRPSAGQAKSACPADFRALYLIELHGSVVAREAQDLHDCSADPGHAPGSEPNARLERWRAHGGSAIGLAPSCQRGVRSIGHTWGDDPVWMVATTSNPCRSYSRRLSEVVASRYAS